MLASGGVKEAAALLRLDPKTVRARERATDLALVPYRGGNNTDKVGPDGRVYGETGEEDSSAAQRDADRMWFTIAQDKRPLLGNRAGRALYDGPRAQTTLERWHQIHDLLEKGAG
ncbi:hypothetical protein [Streptomyces fructofermentans]|uniref:Uncharacterized protein n=1 Tax=Streptomyces fructofermentans TaxID=152141 RepID=A0A918KR38_9ACTN|nr:hypothetical protein [Streptomyces fructofermentans]GGX70280.1 hypothetical protein GCM10010515_42490 [Streptomyces fructofermentans]